MSSYLNFYLVPRKKEGQDEEPKPLRLMSYSRSSNIYQTFYDELSPAFIGIGETPNYSELTVSDANKVLYAVDEECKSVKRRIENTKEVLAVLNTGDAIKDIIDEYSASKEYLEELKDTANAISYIKDIVEDLQYSDFEKMLINID